jgi:hypothetical protein
MAAVSLDMRSVSDVLLNLLELQFKKVNCATIILFLLQHVQPN